ncbi:unnamed protein product [Urochloa humidicola]
MPTTSRCTATTVADGIGRAMTGKMRTEWPELVGKPSYVAHEAICKDRPDVYIEQRFVDEPILPGPRDERRVRIVINHIFDVVPPAPIVG